MLDLNVTYLEPNQPNDNYVYTFVQFKPTVCPDTKFKYKRLLLLFEDSRQNILKNVATTFDLISVRPKDDKTLQLAVNLDIDIISLDLTKKVFLKHSIVKQARNNQIFLEIVYSQGFDQDTRAQWMANVRLLIEISKGKNLVISSGANNPMDLRDDASIANILHVLGMNPQQIHQTIKINPQLVMKKAALRKLTYKGTCTEITDHPLTSFLDNDFIAI